MVVMSMYFSQTYRIYLEDTDAGGIVYHANHFKRFERCRRDWLRTLGMHSYFYQQQSVDGIQHHSSSATQFVVSDANIRYKKPILLDSLVTVSVEVLHLKSASLRLAQSIVDEQQQLLSEAEIGLVCVSNRMDNAGKTHVRPTRFPPTFVELIIAKSD